ncbi:ecto-NOX disulfide-thiol exchanger 2-like isoform X4 [Leucoraja erinacea]|uniref:ecto-NOX disulfide-thiol exchanger 2-like isoform X4 n=1 Tax=Leucoraja erinaceus TaxID=7782 RepID=UPI0024580F33|nr:ecto-NOX disulfide-thiol exchanger 2-like isoform X4 [Leucoraja erinacea]
MNMLNMTDVDPTGTIRFNSAFTENLSGWRNVPPLNRLHGNQMSRRPAAVEAGTHARIARLSCDQPLLRPAAPSRDRQRPIFARRSAAWKRRTVDQINSRGLVNGLNQLPFDLANNNKPPEFNDSDDLLMTEYSIDHCNLPGRKRKLNNIVTEEHYKNLAFDSSPQGMSLSDSTAWEAAMNSLGMGPMGMRGQPLMPEFDRGPCMMTGIPPMNPMMPGLGIVPPPIHQDMFLVKEIIHCKNCTLFPPNPSYGIRIGSSTDKKDTGHLHVDYAQARDDLYEWECKQRMMARNERHRRRVEEERFRLPSPPPIVHYSEHESITLSEKLRDDSKFSEAVQTLYTWLERGEVNRRSANVFYSMIQSSNSHIRRLMGEKIQHEKEMEESKDKFKNAVAGILIQLEQIVSVFHSASKQKAWDHFSKAQRKNLHMWRKQAEEIRNIHNDELMSIRREEEMEMSDDDVEEMPTNKMTEESELASQAEALKEENDSLRCQLDAYRNEVDLLKHEQGKLYNTEEEATKDQQLKLLQQTLQGMQQQLLNVREDCKKKEAELQKAEEDKQNAEMLLETFKNKESAGDDMDETDNEGNNITRCTILGSIQEQDGELDKVIPGPVRSEREALLVGIISTFLHVHPFGASIDYMCSYLQRLDAKISPGEIEGLMMRLHHVFQQEISGVGASLEKRWKFSGFDGIKTLQN